MHVMHMHSVVVKVQESCAVTRRNHLTMQGTCTESMHLIFGRCSE